MTFELFDEERFKSKVEKAVIDVQRILENHRNPRLAEDVDHVYGDKYRLVDQITNTALIGQLNVLAHFGLTSEVLKSIDTSKSSTLRFQASQTCTFLNEQILEVPIAKTVTSNEHIQTFFGSLFSAGSTTKTTIKHVIHQVKEYHWKVQVQWEISLHSGTSTTTTSSVDDKKVLQTRSSSTVVIIQSNKRAPLADHRECKPMDLALTWLMEQIDTNTMSMKFYVDTQDPKTKTPRRNRQVDDALRFMSSLETWSNGVREYFLLDVQHDIIDKHNSAGSTPTLNQTSRLLISLSDDGIFVPVQVLLEELSENVPPPEARPKSFMAFPESSTKYDNSDSLGPSPVLSTQDMLKFLNEQIRSIEEQMEALPMTYPARERNEVVSVAEASIVLLSLHSKRLGEHFEDAVTYVERMLCRQLEAAIGKHVTSSDIDQFVRYHNARLLNPAPQPFCYSIRRAGHYPCGLISIEGSSHSGAAEKKPIETFSREVESVIPTRLPLNSATTVDLTGKKYLHGWMHHRFGGEQNHFELVARARQFSSFLLVVGTMAGPDKLHPKDAIIVQNKDELSIPLMLSEIPTSKEFKDAIRSLSPEQQRFAQAFRSMQLGSSVLGICVIQIKPQLEVLLGLGRDALTKEMKLTQDLMELFVEYQIPADLLSCDKIEAGVVSSPKEQVDNVRNHVKAILDVIDDAKTKQLEVQTMKADRLLSSDLAFSPQTEPFRIIDHSIPRDCPPQDQIVRAINWARYMGLKVPGIQDGDEVFGRPADVRHIPRDGKQREVDQSQLNWDRQPNLKIPGVTEGDDTFDRPCDVRFLPRDDKATDEMKWQRSTNEKIPGVRNDEDVFNRPGDVRSLPRDDKPTDGRLLEMRWQRSTNEKIPGVRNDEDVFDRPGDVRSLPCDDKPTDERHPEMRWQRSTNEKIPGIRDDEDVFDRPGDIRSIPRDGWPMDEKNPDCLGYERSIPRDGKPKDEDHPEMIWQRPPGGKLVEVPNEYDIVECSSYKRIIPTNSKPKDVIWQRPPGGNLVAIPDEDDIFDRPGDVRSIPRNGKPKDEDHPEMIWNRPLGSKPVGARDEDNIFDRPGDARSIPIHAKPNDDEHAASAVSLPIPDKRTPEEKDCHPLDSTERVTEAAEKRDDEDIDFTAVPRILNSAIEKHSGGAALRSTTISLSPTWQRQRLENLLNSAKVAILHAESDLKTERNKAFDLLDAISRSGELPIRCSELHVIVCVTHCFEKDVIETVIQDNSNPIEKLELSTLLVASAIHGVPVDRLVRCSSDLVRLRCSHPLLFSADQKGATDV